MKVRDLPSHPRSRRLRGAAIEIEFVIAIVIAIVIEFVIDIKKPTYIPF